MDHRNINSLAEFQELLDKAPNVFLLIYKKGAEQSDCAMKQIEAAGKPDDPVLVSADVNTVKDIHPHYGITSAPSLLHFSEGSLKNTYKGCQPENVYASLFSGKGFSYKTAKEGRQKKVTVYTTPTCTWCNTIKTYFRENQVNFTEVNVAADPSRAEEMVRKSGQQGVPQTDIDGQVVVGFDKQRINDLLEIRSQ